MRQDLSAMALGMVISTGAAIGPHEGLSAEDRDAVSAITLAYRDAWLDNNPDAVMSTLTPGAVLLPRGLEPLSGAAAMRTFWWPSGGPRATVTAMQPVIAEIAGEGNIAVVRGQGSVTERQR